jgi:hypothetical protein
MSDDAPDMLVCGPPRGRQVPGTALALCADCGKAIAVAPSGQALVSKGAVAVCLACGMDRVEADPDPRLGAISAEQLDELRQVLRRPPS